MNFHSNQSESTAVFSEEQLLSMPHLGKAEVVDGSIIMTPANTEHGGLSMLLGSKMLVYVQEQKLGWVFDSSTGFYMSNGNVRSPDVSFVSKDRLKGLKRLPRRYFRGAPDLAVEILSPNDRPEETDRKIKEYFDSGCRLVWIVDPETQRAEIRHTSDARKSLTKADSLEGGKVLPGFSLRLSDLLDAVELEQQ